MIIGDLQIIANTKHNPPAGGSESKNPMVEQQFHNLVTLLELTKDNKDGK